MRIVFINIVIAIATLFITNNVALGQKLNYSIELGSNISFLSNQTIALGYSLPISPATGNQYRTFNNSYNRNGDVGVGATLGFKLNYNYGKKFNLISGLSFDYLNNTIRTTLSSSSNYFSLTNEHPQLTIGENINGYIPYDNEGNSLWRILIDENGIPVRTDETDFETYKIEEKSSYIYISIPLKIGYSVTKIIQFNLGVINSLLIYSNINTTYPFTDNRILKDNISTVNKYLFSVEGGISFKVAKWTHLFLNYQRSITDIIDLNSRYDVESGNKLNNFIIGLQFQISKKE